MNQPEATAQAPMGWPAPRSEQARGTVSLVGAGPGDLELLTLRALRRVQMAEVLVYDKLVGPDIVALAPAHCERIYVGKAARQHTMAQEQICQLLVQHAKAGKRVVRLKGGDPFVFGRGGEEMDELIRHAVPMEIVPGITAALGAAASFGFPLTHRDYAQSCVFVTGHLKEHGTDLHWPALAQSGQTLVIYMGVTGLEVIARALQDAGLSPRTPAALVYKATWPEQRIWFSDVGQMYAVAQAHGIKPPTLLVVGEVLRLAGRKGAGLPAVGSQG